MGGEQKIIREIAQLTESKAVIQEYIDKNIGDLQSKVDEANKSLNEKRDEYSSLRKQTSDARETREKIKERKVECLELKKNHIDKVKELTQQKDQKQTDFQNALADYQRDQERLQQCNLALQSFNQRQKHRNTEKELVTRSKKEESTKAAELKKKEDEKQAQEEREKAEKERLIQEKRQKAVEAYNRMQAKLKESAIKPSADFSTAS